MLRNRYYLGVVTGRGVEYPGKHPALVTPETFAAVQAVLAAHRLSGERSLYGIPRIDRKSTHDMDH